MLSSIGRAAIRRVGAGASHRSTNRVLESISHLQRVAKANNVGATFILRQFSSSLLRSYATATQKAKARTKTSAAKAKPKTKKAAPKKPVKKAVKKKPKKKVAAKPKPKPKKRILTPKQKERAERQQQSAELKSLKAAALTPPKPKPATVWTLILKEATSGHGGAPANIGQWAKEASAKYKSLTPTELEQYNRTINQNKAENEIAYKKFIDSHNPDEIRLANNARNMLKAKVKAKTAKKSVKKLSSLQDSRLPIRPRAAWILFSKERWSSGDMKGLKAIEASQLIFKEYKELSPSQRKPYEDQALAEQRRYTQEFKTVFGRDTPDSVRRAAAA